MRREASHPWRNSRAPEFRDFRFTPRFDSARAMFEAAVRAAPDAPAVHDFDSTLSYGQADRLSDAMAGVLHDHGVTAGERVALFLQKCRISSSRWWPPGTSARSW